MEPSYLFFINEKKIKMKKLLFTIMLFFGFAFAAQSQTLQFSQVLLVTSIDTVPQGKVWKVTSYLGTDGYLVSNGPVLIKVNGINNAIATRQCPYNGYDACFAHSVPFPLWFNSNTILELFTGCQSLSVIEFNVN